MLGPSLRTGIEEGNGLAGQGIFAFGHIGLELVARVTSEADVLKRSWAAFRDGPNMIEGQGNAAVGFAGQAITTTVAVGRFNAGAQAVGKVG